MKKKYIIGIGVLLLLGAGATFGIIYHNNEVQAERIVKQKRDALLEKEKENLATAKSAVDLAYETRSDKDIEEANKAIDKLSDNQKEDKTKLNDRMKKLNGFIKLISDVDTAIAKATESRSDADIDAAQSLIDKEIDEYLKNDKISAQKKIDDLKAQIDKENEEKEKAAKAAQTQQMEQNEAAQQAQQDTAKQQNQASNQQTYQEQPQPNYQEQQPQQAPNNPAPSQSTPSGGGNNLPSGPVQGGGSNGAGIENSPGGNDGVGGIEWGY